MSASSSFSQGTTAPSSPVEYSSDGTSGVGTKPSSFFDELRELVEVPPGVKDRSSAEQLCLLNVKDLQRKAALRAPPEEQQQQGYAVDVVCKKFPDGSIRMLLDLNISQPELEYLVTDVGYLHIASRTLYMTGINGVTSRVVDISSPFFRTHIPNADTLIQEALATKATTGDACSGGAVLARLRLPSIASQCCRTPCTVRLVPSRAATVAHFSALVVV